jgi:hypothetical protein
MVDQDGRAMNGHLQDAESWTGGAGFGDPRRFLPAAAGEPTPAGRS